MVKDVGPRAPNNYQKKRARKNILQFASELQNAVNRSMPTEVKPYKGVFVLAAHFSNDQMGVASLENELCRGFARVYGYTVEKYIIDATLSQSETRRKFRGRIDKFANDYDKQGNLLIVVYSGHADFVQSTGRYLFA